MFVSLRRVCTKCSLDVGLIFVIARRWATKTRSGLSQATVSGFAVLRRALIVLHCYLLRKNAGLAWETSKASACLVCFILAPAIREETSGRRLDGLQGSSRLLASVFTAASWLTFFGIPDGCHWLAYRSYATCDRLFEES